MSLPAFAEIAVPRHSDAVVDDAGILAPAVRAQLSASLQRYRRDHGPQIQVLTVADLEGEPIESFSIRVVDRWKLGDKNRDDGVLLLVAPKSRAVRIEVGQSLEGRLPDALTGRIIQDAIIPMFREGRFDEGVLSGAQAIARTLGAELTGAPVPAGGRRGQPSPLGNLLSLLFLLLIIFPRMLGGRRRGIGAGLLTGLVIGRGMSSDDGFGGGGFGGGRGGGFSGGGASGSW